MMENTHYRLITTDQELDGTPFPAANHCFFCGEDQIDGRGAIVEGFDIVDGFQQETRIAICLRCLPHLGFVAGLTCSDSRGAYDFENLKNLTFEFWHGLSEGRQERLSMMQEAFDKKTEQATQATEQVKQVTTQLEQAYKQIKALEARLQNPPPPGPQYCYLMRRPNGHHKIGISNDVDRRHDQIRRDFPGTSLIGWFDCDDMRQAEKLLHLEYAEKRQDGEWFDLSDDDVRDLMSIGRFENGEFWRRPIILKNTPEQQRFLPPTENDSKNVPF